MSDERQLLEKFVACFVPYDDKDERDFVVLQTTDPSACELLPGRFPPLYQQLILSYRWRQRVELDDQFRMLANPPGPDFTGLKDEIFQDPALSECLQKGYVQFGFGPYDTYDPVCFDMNKPSKDGDFPIVLLDHEQILCYSRMKILKLLAPSFQELVLNVVSAMSDA